MPNLIALDRLSEVIPEWPFSTWATARLVRTGRLGCVRIGRRIYMTREIIDAFVTTHTVSPPQLSESELFADTPARTRLPASPPRKRRRRR
jgi:hypothetical protein